MRVALVDTLDKTAGYSGPNVAISALAGYLLKNGHEVGIIDLFYSSEEEQYCFFQQQWGLMGITATSFAFNVALEVAKTVKEISTQPPYIVLGGAHVSIAREGVLSEPEIDFAIYGEGEMPLLSLVELLEKEKHPVPTRLREINGLIFRDGDDIVVNSPSSRITSLDSLPLPPYHLFPMNSYSMHTLSTSRGCPYACVYCASAAILGKKWVPKSPQRIIEEIDYTVSRWGKRPFVIVDESFNLEKDRVKVFCNLLIDKKIRIKWSMCGGMRADKVDLEMLLLMKESGCSSIGIGVESANPQILNNIGKGETIEQIRQSIRLIRKAGIWIHASFMIGNPGETLETVKESIEFANSEGLDGASFFIAIPYPNTKLWQYVEEKGRFLHKDYVNYHDNFAEPFFETDDFTFQERVEAYKLAKREMLKLKARTILRRLPYLIQVFYKNVHSDGLLITLKKMFSFMGGQYMVKFIKQRKKKIAEGKGFKRIETRFSHQL